MNEMKTMDYQHYQEYLSDSIIELGHYEDLGIAIEQATLFEENPAKLGITGKFKTEVIRMVCETGRGDIFDDGYLVVADKQLWNSNQQTENRRI